MVISGCRVDIAVVVVRFFLELPRYKVDACICTQSNGSVAAVTIPSTDAAYSKREEVRKDGEEKEGGGGGGGGRGGGGGGGSGGGGDQRSH